MLERNELPKVNNLEVVNKYTASSLLGVFIISTTLLATSCIPTPEELQPTFNQKLKPISSAAKVALFVSEEFPQIPIKPLGLITPTPTTEQIELGEGQEKIIGDLLIPESEQKNPALIVAMGVRTSEKDKPMLLGFSETLSRLGYVVLWPRLQALENETVKNEQPETFVRSYQYLQERPEVDKDRISFVGFSVGSSIAMVAAENPSINDKVHGFVFFGGYYNIKDYLHSLATKSMTIDNQQIPWEPSQDGINHAQRVLDQYGLKVEQFKKPENSTSEQIQRLLRYSPDQRLKDFKASIFILHDKSDSYVPYAESEKLKNALEGKVSITYHQSDLFAHVQPQQETSLKILRELFTLWGFLHKIFMHI